MFGKHFLPVLKNSEITQKQPGYAQMGQWTDVLPAQEIKLTPYYHNGSTLISFTVDII